MTVDAAPLTPRTDPPPRDPELAAAGGGDGGRHPQALPTARD
jgi:hypothetical protein